VSHGAFLILVAASAALGNLRNLWILFNKILYALYEMNPTRSNRRALEWWQYLLCAAGAGLIAFFGLGLVEHHGIQLGWPLAAVAGFAALILTGIGIVRLIERNLIWWQCLLCAAGAGLLAFMALTLWEHHPNPVLWAIAAVAVLAALILTVVGFIRLIK
jgi:hypothetical protein